MTDIDAYADAQAEMEMQAEYDADKEWARAQNRMSPDYMARAEGFTFWD